MGGVGKTTLARYAHDDPLTLHHFDVRAWVTVSQGNSARGVLLSILHSINATKTGLDDVYLVRSVYQYLKGRRYVIVIDDIWSTNVWDELRAVFPNDFNGSRIVITTRLLEVASYVDSSSRPYEVHLMDVDRSWCLLKEKVFGRRENCPSELEHIGRLIAENCRGLPLAVVVIAGVLSKADRRQESWANIARNVKTVVKNSASDDRFSEILSLSYAYLPHYLRPCFLYMGCFPEDHEINVSKLVKLWAAEGFLRPNGSDDLEELAEGCLEELVKRSLILVTRKKYDGRIKRVKIHDLLRDLCISKARDEKFLCVINEFPLSSSQGIIDQSSRRLSILANILGGFRNTNGSPIHTILLFKHTAVDSWRSFRLLRVVDAFNIIMASYPDQIFELFHLRYLAFTFETDHKKVLEYDFLNLFLNSRIFKP
ncbi:putative late blight resistance protein homolog r1b-17 [Phtheirospermum japonicum]|uniref:Putative late blight resistance protein homolog r1b-17 n=1 Tax=Phtheirospermum japonicum TaxID=374723 RepID=A0A830BIX2_9LAMI|nr:putative late blight resistance protein homolog r1b-17 [Phtheirospermum japonicum]